MYKRPATNPFKDLFAIVLLILPISFYLVLSSPDPFAVLVPSWEMSHCFAQSLLDKVRNSIAHHVYVIFGLEHSLHYAQPADRSLLGTLFLLLQFRPLS